MADKIRVLIIDDSTLMREALKSTLESDPAIEVIGMAKDGKEGVEKAFSLKPDVITTDLKMPVMAGLEEIQKIMEEHPIPIIIVSGMDVNVIIKGLGIGAMDFVVVTQDMEEIAKDLIEKVKIASRVRPLKRMKLRPHIPSLPIGRSAVFKVIAIGVSTGGPQALQEVISRLPADFPAGILVVQHMSRGFISGLVDWLRINSRLEVKVAESGDVLKSSMILFAPDDYNMKIDSSGKIILADPQGKTGLHVPSIDIMMQSVAESYGENAIGLIMTGMGSDGVEGIRAIKKAGGSTIAQDGNDSVVFGMNKLAIESGCVDKIVELEKIGDEIIRML